MYSHSFSRHQEPAKPPINLPALYRVLSSQKHPSSALRLIPTIGLHLSAPRETDSHSTKTSQLHSLPPPPPLPTFDSPNYSSSWAFFDQAGRLPIAVAPLGQHFATEHQSQCVCHFLRVNLQSPVAHILPEPYQKRSTLKVPRAELASAPGIILGLLRRSS